VDESRAQAWQVTLSEIIMNWTHAALPIWIIGAPLLVAVIDCMRTPIR
jgi:hypothetical protein